MLKSIVVLGLLGTLGGGTYVAVQKCGSSSAACPIETTTAAAATTVGDACATPCCETDAVAKTAENTADAPCPVEAPAQEVTKSDGAVEAADAPAVQ